MPGLTPSSPVNATGTLRGLVSTAAQTFAGVKTFLGLIVASAGVQVASIFNTNGTGASDVVVKVGTTVADASVNQSAKLLSIATGLGGTEVESFRFSKGGIASGADANSVLRLDGAIGAAIEYSNGRVAVNSVGIAMTANGGDGASTALAVNTWFSWVGSGNRLLSLLNQGSTRWQVGVVGNVFQYGTDSTASPGAATIHKPIGKSAIAVGASSVVITNSLVTAASHVIITPHARDATCKEVIAVPGAGTITVSGTANATAALPFSWELKGLL